MDTILSSQKIDIDSRHPIEPSSTNEIEQALAILNNHKNDWAKMEIPERILFLDKVKRDLPKVEKEWITKCLTAKEEQFNSMAEAEEWYGITAVYRQINFLRKALQDIVRYGKPKIPGSVTTRPDGQVVAQVIPYDWKEKMTLLGIKAEVWMEPSVSLQEIPQAAFYNNQNKKGQVCAILGAGNFAGLIPADFLNKLFVEGQVVALKMNPVNEYLGKIFEEGFKVLIHAGYLQILYGGAEEGADLCNHPKVDNIHITGSDITFDKIIFGSGEQGKKQKRAKEAQFKKSITAELGNISPVIVIPGPWTKKDIKNQAARFGSWQVPNASCNCLTPRVFIQMMNWKCREELIEGIGDFLAETKTRKAYYPGSFELHQQFLNTYPQAQQHGVPKSGHLPWTFIPDVNCKNENELCFQREPFLSLYSETAIEAINTVDFINKAVAFANKKLWGTLVASIVVHPKSMKDPAIAAAVDQAITDLRYGSIVINQCGALAHYMALTPWGAHSGSNIYDVQSGIGFVNNPLMFDRVQKSVIYADFCPLADPFLANTSNSYLYFRQDTRYHFKPSLINMLKLIWRVMTIRKAKHPL